MKKHAIAALALGFTTAIAPQAWSQTASAPTNGIAWDGSASAGLTLTRGNSRTLLGTVTFNDDGKWQQNELKLGADAAYGESTINNVNSETAESLHGFAQYNRLFSERFYGYARLDGLHDGIADIQYRVTLAPGAGYYFIKEKTTDLSGEVGPGFVTEKLGDNTESYLSLRIADTFHYALSGRARVWQTAELLPQVDKFENYILNSEVGVEADLSDGKKLTLRTYLDDSYDNRPALGRLKNDLKLVTAIAYKF